MKLPSDRDRCAFTTSQEILSALYRHAKERSVPEKIAHWYVNWARQFLRYIKGKKFHDCTITDVQSFVAYLRSKNTVSPWQLAQVKDALLIIYKDLLNTQWAADINSLADTIGSLELKDSETVEEHNTPPQSSDKLSASTAVSSHKAIFYKLKTEIRVRHYSIRTEQSYDQWVRRFLYFLKMKPIEEITTEDVKDYLNYLAVEKNVAASTQNLALNAMVFLFTHVLEKSIFGPHLHESIRMHQRSGSGSMYSPRGICQ